MQYSTIQHSTVQQSIVQYNAVQYSTVQYNAVQHNSVQYNAVEYSYYQYIPHVVSHYMMDDGGEICMLIMQRQSLILRSIVSTKALFIRTGSTVD